MEHEFDPNKDTINKGKHGLSLSFGVDIFEKDINYLIVPTIREEDGEDRYKIIGMVDGTLYIAVFTWVGAPPHYPRFISVREANNGEIEIYNS